MTKKLQISMDDRLIERLDTYADDNYLSRSGTIAVAVSQFLNQQEAVYAVKRLSIAMQRIADTNSLSDEDLAELDDIKRSIVILTGEK